MYLGKNRGNWTCEQSIRNYFLKIDLKKNHIELIEMKNIIIAMKNSVDWFTIG